MGSWMGRMEDGARERTWVSWFVVKSNRVREPISKSRDFPSAAARRGCFRNSTTASIKCSELEVKTEVREHVKALNISPDLS